ncbi:inositol 1,4,5-trisphosphate receptor-like, partial [Paramuricea clavata]
LSRHNKELAGLLRPPSPPEGDEEPVGALDYYSRHTAQIEIVRSDRMIEQIVYPVPQICEYLTERSKHHVFKTTERDEHGSKVSDFFSRSDDLFNEMQWQKKLRENKMLFWVSNQMLLWERISMNLAVLINILVALFYPFSGTVRVIDYRLSLLVWIAMFISFALIVIFPRPSGVRTFMFAVIVRLFFSIGLEFTLLLLGIVNLLAKGVFLVGFIGNKGTFQYGAARILTDKDLLFHLCYFGFCVVGLCINELFYSVLLLDIVLREETLINVVRSVTRNGRSIILTALLALILVYLFSIVGFLFLKDDFLVDAEPRLPRIVDSGGPSDDKGVCPVSTSWENRYFPVQDNDNDVAESVKEHACETLALCILTTLNKGLRNGGGIGDVLRPPSLREPMFVGRVVYDMLFFFIVIIIVLNLIFGVIIDTFADLRSEKQNKEEILKNTCFICGLGRAEFVNKVVSFDDHIKTEHNLWHYLYFIVLLRLKKRTDFTGPQSYVHELIKQRNLEWFPRMRTLSLAVDADGESEQNDVKILHEKLDNTTKQVQALSTQLKELREQMSEQRKYKQRHTLLAPQTSLNCTLNGMIPRT